MGIVMELSWLNEIVKKSFHDVKIRKICSWLRSSFFPFPRVTMKDLIASDDGCIIIKVELSRIICGVEFSLQGFSRKKEHESWRKKKKFFEARTRLGRGKFNIPFRSEQQTSEIKCTLRRANKISNELNLRGVVDGEKRERRWEDMQGDSYAVLLCSFHSSHLRESSSSSLEFNSTWHITTTTCRL
jgi:hypothetical protein